MKNKMDFRAALAFIAILCAASTANGQTAGIVSESVVVTAATINPTLATTGFQLSPSFGSVSQPTTLDGYTYVDFKTLMADRGTEMDETMTLGNVKSDPGASWLQSLVCNGVSFPVNTRSYNATAQTLSYGFLHSSSPLTNRIFVSGTQIVCQLVHIGNSGWVRSKYQVVGLTYAPPGAKSTATYSSGFMNGTGTSDAASYTSGVTQKISVGVGGSFFDIAGGKSTLSAAAGYTQERDSTNSVSIVEQNSSGIVVPGPASSGLGVDHDYDTVYIWLNPEVFVELGNGIVYQGQYGWDGRDTVTGMDVVTLTVGQLRGAQPISDAALVARLARTWDSAQGGLTSTDYLAIAKADPFYSNPSFNPNTDTTHRYEFPSSGSPATPTDLIFNYIPVPAGGQATAQNFTSNYTSTSSSGQTAKDTHTTTFSIDSTGNVNFFATLSVDLLTTATYTTTNQWSSTITKGTTQTMNLTIIPPLSTDNYTGPTAMQVWKDNVYGTFMFYPEN